MPSPTQPAPLSQRAAGGGIALQCPRWTEEATPDDCIKAVATGVPVHTSTGEVSTQLTGCSGDVCPLPRALYCCKLFTASCQSRPPAYHGVRTPVQQSAQVTPFHCLALSSLRAWCRSLALVDIVTISRYRRGHCHDIVIHKKSTIRALT